MMTVYDVVESYVRDVARYLPRNKRNDVAFELRSLLHEEMAVKAQASGRTPDKVMVMELLAGFGRLAEAAGQRASGDAGNTQTGEALAQRHPILRRGALRSGSKVGQLASTALGVHTKLPGDCHAPFALTGASSGPRRGTLGCAQVSEKACATAHAT
ncbi:MAG: hypothetical protein ABI645_10960 [Pseudomonadota bacterium]